MGLERSPRPGCQPGCCADPGQSHPVFIAPLCPACVGRSFPGLGLGLPGRKEVAGEAAREQEGVLLDLSTSALAGGLNDFQAEQVTLGSRRRGISDPGRPPLTTLAV